MARVRQPGQQGLAGLASLDSLRELDGSGYYHDGSSLYVKLVMPDRAFGKFGFDGEEVVLLVESQYGG